MGSSCSHLLVNVNGSKRKGARTGAGRYLISSSLDMDYQVTNTILGTGMNGAVKMAIGRHDGREYAVKSFNKMGLPQKELAHLKNEADVYLSLDHPHIVRLEHLYETKTGLHMVLEVMKGGELFDRLFKLGSFSEQVAADTVRQMLLAVAYLHAQGVVHRDIKLENFLYESEGSDRVKLTDFGLATRWDGHANMTESLGTLSYVAPEVLAKQYTDTCDIWSLGVVAHLLLTGKPVLKSNNRSQQLRELKRGTIQLTGIGGLSTDAQHFLRSLLNVDPSRRPRAAKALEHNWLSRHCCPKVVDTTFVNNLRVSKPDSAFKRACLHMLAWSLSQAHLELADELLWLSAQFDALDLDHNGKIDKDELFRVLGDGDESEALFGQLGNGDNAIGYSEFLAAALGRSPKLREAAVHEAFRRFDADRDGQITPSDIAAVLGDSDVELMGGAINFNGFCEYLNVGFSPKVPWNSAGPTFACSGGWCGDGLRKLFQGAQPRPTRST